MLTRVLTLLLVFGFSISSSFSQTGSTYVLNGLGGQYHNGNISLSVTLGQPFAAKLESAGSIVSVGFEQPQIQINTGLLADSILCKRQNLIVPYSAWGYIDSQNIFTAQLSDDTGSFANAVIIGAVTGTRSGFITSTLPSVLAPGSNYKIRVVSSAPKINGKNNQEPLSSGTCETGIIEQNITSIFRCFPNPVTDLVYFYTPGRVGGKIRIYDLTGNVVMELANFQTDQPGLDLSKLASGIYMASYLCADTNLTLKIIKQ